MKVLAIIPARGGSKGVPDKNLRKMHGKSLVVRAHACALASSICDRVILSTDSEEIASHARSEGIEVPFLRPGSLADDTAPMIDVVLHAVDHAEMEGYSPDVVLLLQPTSPLRTPEHLRKAIGVLRNSNDFDAVCSVEAIPRSHSPEYVMKISEEGVLEYFLPEGRMIKRRQDAAQAFVREGTVYATRIAALRESISLYGTRCYPLVMEAGTSLSIDTEADWSEAERRLAEIRQAESKS